jgi:hypothetical protein
MPPRKPSVTRALARALNSRPVEPWEEATAALAKRLAGELDTVEDLKVLGDLSARLLPVLAGLGMTRQVAASVARGGAQDGRARTSALDELKARRRAH